MTQPLIKSTAIDVGTLPAQIPVYNALGVLAVPTNGLTVGGNQLIIGGPPGAYYVRTEFDLNAYGQLQLGSTQQNSLYTDDNDQLAVQNNLTNTSSVRVVSRRETALNTSDRDVSVRIERIDESNNSEFIELYNRSIVGEQRHGLRIHRRGTGAFRPFVIDWSDGVALPTETLQITETDLTVFASTTFERRTSLAGSFTPPDLTPFDPDIELDASISNVFEVDVLTGNVATLTILSPQPGQTIKVRFEQDGTGGRTVALPIDVKVAGSVELGANRVSWLIITYSARALRWEGYWQVIPA